MSERWTTEEMMTLAQSGVRKVDQMGRRGATMVNFEEITAMAALIVVLSAQLHAALEASNAAR